MKKLRSGYTTGACAAAAAKAATLMLTSGLSQDQVTIPFPDGTRVSFKLCACRWSDPAHTTAFAAVIKDAGDDPDVTNRARIEAEVRFGRPLSIPGAVDTGPSLACAHHDESQGGQITIVGGKGVGTVTKPGLAIPVGEPAINPVPRKMIREAVAEALSLPANSVDRPLVVNAPARRSSSTPGLSGTEAFMPSVSGSRGIRPSLVVTISIPDGEELATKTLNHRLGIIGGLSILGTTGIVRPVSAEAWTATISTSMDVARAAGVTSIVLSTGRTSEVAVQKRLLLPEEACVMMGDYLHFSLDDAGKHGFAAIHLAAMWAKVLKAAMRIPQTHVRHGALEVDQAISFLATLGAAPSVLNGLTGSNTAREIYERLITMEAHTCIRKVCGAARDYCQEVSGLPVTVYLVTAGQGRPSVACVIDGTEATAGQGRPSVAKAIDGTEATRSRQIVESGQRNLPG
ncbi:MAG: cobalt-precorrin-5B (C(1))-methyltransferase [Desulfoarculaceae bacterium]|nr:cobalt-precorrin-5B (C(1))-methyltransferase [Desulfoarculaceae bacterium]